LTWIALRSPTYLSVFAIACSLPSEGPAPVLPKFLRILAELLHDFLPFVLIVNKSLLLLVI